MMQLIDIVAAGLKNSSGVALDSGTVTVYEAGTTTPVSIYSDYEALSPLSNPVTLDSVGRKNIWVDRRVKLLIKDSDGSTIDTIDDVGVSDAQIASAAGSLGAGAGLSSSGGSLAVNVDDSTIEINGDTLRIKDGGTTPAKMSTSAGQQISSSSSTFSSTSASLVDITNLSVSVTTYGRPVFVGLVPDGTDADCFVSLSESGGGAAEAELCFFRDATKISRHAFEFTVAGRIFFPPGCFWTIDVPAAGTYTYKAQGLVSTASDTFSVTRCKLAVILL